MDNNKSGAIVYSKNVIHPRKLDRDIQKSFGPEHKKGGQRREENK